MSTSRERALLTVPEAAALAGLARSVAYRLVAQDCLPGLLRLPGCRILVRRSVLEAWLTGDELTEGGRGAGGPAPPK